jgi:hypothetical protein
MRDDGRGPCPGPCAGRPRPPVDRVRPRGHAADESPRAGDPAALSSWLGRVRGRHRGRSRGGLPDPPARLPRPRPRLVPRGPGRPLVSPRPAARSAKVDGRVVSHVHFTERSIRYGSASLPMNGIMWVGTLPEYRGLGFAQNLMRLGDGRGPRGQGGVPGPHHRDAAVLPPARLGGLRPADLRRLPEPEPPPGQRRRDRGQGGLLARPPLAAGRAQRPDGPLRPPVRRGHRQRRPLGRLLAVDDRQALRPRHLGRLPGGDGPGLRLRQGPQGPGDRHQPGPPAGPARAAGAGSAPRPWSGPTPR